MNEDLFYLGIKIMIIDNTGKILLLLRTPSKTNNRTLWDIPGGRIRRGEDIETALGRELFEETGLRVGDRQVQFVGASLSNSRISMNETDAGLILFVHKCQWNDCPEVRLSSEHSDFWWASPEDAVSVIQSHIPQISSVLRGKLDE